MTPGVSVPSWTGVALSVVLVALTAGLAYHQHLGLTRPLLIASARAGVQLVGVGVPHQRPALRTALLPAIDSTKVVGLISSTAR